MPALPSEAPLRIAGRTFAAGRSRAEPATLELSGEGARLVAADGREIVRLPRGRPCRTARCS